MTARLHRIRHPEKRPTGRLSPDLAATLVFNRGTYVGAIVEAQGGQYEAGKANGESLGLFTSPAAAAHALLEAHHARRR